MSQSQPTDRESREDEARSASGAAAESVSDGLSGQNSESNVHAVTANLGWNFLGDVKTAVADALGALNDSDEQGEIVFQDRR